MAAESIVEKSEEVVEDEGLTEEEEKAVFLKNDTAARLLDGEDPAFVLLEQFADCDDSLKRRVIKTLKPYQEYYDSLQKDKEERERKKKENPFLAKLLEDMRQEREVRIAALSKEHFKKYGYPLLGATFRS